MTTLLPKPKEEAWFLDDDFWRAAEPFVFSESNFSAAVDQVDTVLALAELSAEGLSPEAALKLLDLACGPGRHAIPFAQRGFSVTGVDASRYLLKKARARAAEAGAEIEWINEDMRSFIRPSTFDLALCLFTSFGYFESAEENQKVLQNVFESLKPGGAFVMDVVGKERVAQIFQAASASDIPGGGVLIERRRVIDDWSKMENDWIFIHDGAAQTFRIRHWLHSGLELGQLLLSAGFSEVRLYGGFDGSPYDREATRLIAVARKSST